MEVKGNFINYGSYVDVHDNERVYLSVEKGKVKIDEAKVMEAEKRRRPRRKRRRRRYRPIGS